MIVLSDGWSWFIARLLNGRPRKHSVGGRLRSYRGDCTVSLLAKFQRLEMFYEA